MRYNNKHIKAIVAIVATTASVFACMTIEDIIFPDNPQVDSDIEITVKTKLEPQNKENTQMVFAILAPKSWNLKDNAQVFLTTDGYAVQGGAEIVNEQMVLMEESAHEPTTDTPWTSAYQSRLGTMGNQGPVEWTIFRTNTSFKISDDVSTDFVYGNVKIKLHTGKESIKFFMGFDFNGASHGFHEEYYKDNAKSKVLEVTGGGAIDDYTTVKYVSTIPSVFRYGDIFSIQFASTIGDNDTELYDAESPISEVYLCGKAVLEDGTEIIKENIDKGSLMEMTSEITYQKYIYPKSFFGLKDGQKIKETYFYFYNKDKSKKFKPGDNGFQISQSAE